MQILYIGGTNTGSQRQVRIVRVDREGRPTPIDSTWEGVFNYAALSPDGTRLALTVFSDERQGLWVKALDRGPITRLTFEGAVNYRPTWLANGREIAFISDQSGPALPYVVRADGSGKPVRLAVPDTAQIDEIEFAPGGEWIVYRRGTVNGNRRLAMFRPGVDSTPNEISSGRFDEYSPTVSPDGRWLAYVSVESGREEVYVRPFPDVEPGPLAGVDQRRLVAGLVVERQGAVLRLRDRSADEDGCRAADPTFRPPRRRSCSRPILPAGTLSPVVQHLRRRPVVHLRAAGQSLRERGIRDGAARLAPDRSGPGRSLSMEMHEQR